jgi:putative endonuclease
MDGFFLIWFPFFGSGSIYRNMAAHHETGARGEELAAEFLQKQGYEILDRNWRHRHYELDLVARDQETIVIVEVKTRTSLYAGEPEVSVNRQKQRTLIRAANAYVVYHGIDFPVRFDIIAIVIKGDQHFINHIEDAFYPMM